MKFKIGDRVAVVNMALSSAGMTGTIFGQSSAKVFTVELDNSDKIRTYSDMSLRLISSNKPNHTKTKIYTVLPSDWSKNPGVIDRTNGLIVVANSPESAVAFIQEMVDCDHFTVDVGDILVDTTGKTWALSTKVQLTEL